MSIQYHLEEYCPQESLTHLLTGHGWLLLLLRLLHSVHASPLTPHTLGVVATVHAPHLAAWTHWAMALVHIRTTLHGSTLPRPESSHLWEVGSLSLRYEVLREHLHLVLHGNKFNDTY